MAFQETYDVVVIGGSYAGLSAALALGRALRRVLIIDANQPCNWQTPHSHNLITQDGATPAHIRAVAKEQVLAYATVEFSDGYASSVTGTNNAFVVSTSAGAQFGARKVLFATGLRDRMPPIEGFANCWGISVIHCPYCHGYEYRHQPTGILANGAAAVEFSRLIRNWTNDLTVFTNGAPTFSEEHYVQLQALGVRIQSQPIGLIRHTNGQIGHLLLTDGNQHPLRALYARLPFEQHTLLPQALGCQLTEMGLLQVDDMKHTTVPGLYAAGDNSSPMRSVSGAIAGGTMAGASINHDLIAEREYAI